jgi:hypothetical protein
MNAISAIAGPSIYIQAFYPGASAETVENTVTQIIEQKMVGLDKMLYLSATSDSAGASRIELTFALGPTRTSPGPRCKTSSSSPTRTFLWTKRTMDEERTIETLEAKSGALEEELPLTRAILAPAVEQASAGIVIVDAPEMKSRLGNIAGHRIIRGGATPMRDIPLSDHLQRWTLLKADGTPYELLERPLARAVFDYPDFPWVDQERLVKTNVALAIGGLKAVVSEGSTNGMLDT